MKSVSVTRGNLVVKSELSPRNGSLALRQLNPIYKKGAQSIFFVYNKGYSLYKVVWRNCELILTACTKLFNALNYYRCKIFTVEDKIF